MATLGAMLVRLGVDDKGFVRAFERDTRSIERFADVADRVGTQLTTALTLPIVGIAGAVGAATASIEGLRRGLEAITGNAAVAEQQFQRLVEVAKLPGVSFEPALRASISLQAVGFSAQFAERGMRGLANAIALSGGGDEEFSAVVRQFRQIAGLGRIMGEELNIIVENAPAIAKALQNAFGTTNAEAIRNLGLTTDQFFTRLYEGFETLPQVKGGLRNAFENLTQAVRRSLGSVLSGGEIQTLIDFLDRLAERIEFAAATFNNLEPFTRRLVIGLVGLAAAAGPAAFVMGKLASGFIAAKGALILLQSLPGKVAAQFAVLRAQVIATQAGLNFNTAAARFQSAAGTFVSSSRAMSLAAAGMSRTAAVTKIALTSITGIILSPGGLLVALSAAATAFANYEIKAAAARAKTEEFRNSLAGLTEEALLIEQAEIDRKIFETSRALEEFAGIEDKIRNPKFTRSGNILGVSMQDVREYSALQKQLEVLKGNAAAVEQNLERVRAATAENHIDNLNQEKSALDKLIERARILLGIYDSRTRRSETALAVLSDLVAAEAQVERLIRAQGDRRTEDLAKALALTVELRDRWEEIFATVQASVTARPEPAQQVAVEGGFGKMIDVVVARANELAGSFQKIAVAAVDTGQKVSIGDRVQGAARTFEVAMDRAAQGGLRGMDRIFIAFNRFADRLGEIVGGVQAAIRDPLGTLVTGLDKLGGATLSVLGRLGSIVNPITLFSATLDQVARNLAPNFEAALAPLEPVFKRLADVITPIVAVIAEALAPILEALVPIIEKLGPVIAAITQVLTPIITALVPLLDIFRVILEALFPIIKTVAIILTYFGQVIFTVAGGIAKAIGSLIEALGKAIDKIPFLGDFGLVKLGRSIKSAGESYLETADALGDARDQIREVRVGDALDYVADSATRAAESFSNIPELFDLALRRRQAAFAAVPAGMSPFAPPTDLGGNLPGGRGGLTVNIYNPAPGVSGEQVGNEVRRVVRDDPVVQAYLAQRGGGRRF